MNNFSFTKNKSKFFLFSVICVVLGILCIVIRGVNWDVDFAGGTVLEYKITNTDMSKVEKDVEAITKNIVGDKFSSVGIASSAAEGEYVVIKCNELENDMKDAIKKALIEKYGAENVVINGDDTVSGAISEGLKRSAIIAISLAVVLMLAYIAIRFKPLSALAAIVCLLHDVFFVFVAYSLLAIPVNSNIIAVALTILGYSINATIVIFDRIRENQKLMGSSYSFEEKTDASVKQTIRRSIFTTITTLLTIGMVYILGVTSIKNFALPLIVGLLAGLYSSVCLAGNLWVVFDKALGKKK